MALTKNVVPMSFSQGVETKSDPYQVPPGKLLLLHNARFQRSKSLIKRFGYTPISKSLSTGGEISSGISAFGYKKEALIQDNSSLYAYSNLNDWTKRSDLKNFDYSTQEVKSDGISKTNSVGSYDPITGIEIYIYSNNTGLYFTAIERATKTIIYDNELLDSSTVSQIQIQYVNTKWLIIYSHSTTNLSYIVKDPANLSNPVAPTSIITSLTTGQCFDSTILGTDTFLAVHKTGSEINIYRFDSSFTILLRKSLTGPLLTNTIGIAAYSTTRILVMYSDSPGTYIKVYDDTNPTASPTANTLSSRTAYTISAVFDGSGNAQVFYFNYSDLGFPSDNKMFSVDFSNTNTSGINNIISAGVLFVSKVFLKGTTCLFYATPMSSTRQNVNLNTLTTTEQQGLYLCGVEYGGSKMKVHQKSNSGTFGFTENQIRVLPQVSQFTESSIARFIFSFLKKTKVTVTNSEIGYINGVSSIDSFESPKAAQRVLLGESLVICAGQTYCYDGLNLVESGFNIYPVINPSYSIDSQGGGLGTYGATPEALVQLVSTYEWTDQNGNLQRSAPSDPVRVQLADSVEPSGNFSGVLLNGSLYGLPVNRTFDIRSAGGTNGLLVGDNVVSATAYPSGTIVEAIYPAGVYGIYPVVVFTTTTGVGVGTSHSFTKPSPGLYTVSITNGSDIISYGTAGVFHIGQRFYKATAAAAGFTDGSTILRDYGNGLYQISAAATATATTSIWSKDASSVTVAIRNTSLTDKQNVSIVLWRTKVNGSIYYRSSNIVAPTFNDKLDFEQEIECDESDDELDGNEQLYTSGGEVENIAPPAFSIVQTFKNRLMGVTKDDENQIFYSKQVIDGYGIEFNDSFVLNVSSTGGKVTGLGVIDEKFIPFKEEKIYYVLGEGPNPMGLQNDFTPCNPINADAGCEEQNKMSVVNIPEGIIFKTKKGFYLLNRSLSLEYIGDAVEAYNSFDVVSAKLLQSVMEARFGLSNGDTLVYDYYHKQWSVDVNNGDSITHVDAENIDGIYNILNSSGVLKKENTAFADSKTISGVQTPCYIPLELDTGWLSFVGIEAFQRIYKSILLGQYKSNHLLTVQVYYDFKEDYFDSIPINDINPGSVEFNYRLFMPRQKCTSIRYKIKESQYSTVIGEGLRLSTISFEVGVKKGLNKIREAKSFG